MDAEEEAWGWTKPQGGRQLPRSDQPRATESTLATDADAATAAPSARVDTSGLDKEGVKALLRRTTRSTKFGEQEDPIAKALVGSKSFDAVLDLAAKDGVSKVIGVLGAGASSIILDTDKGALRLGNGRLAAPTKSAHVIRPLKQGQAGDVRYELMPKADTSNITEADVETIKAALGKDGLSFSDPGVDNLGRVNGKLVVLDPGSVTPTKELDPSTQLDLASSTFVNQALEIQSEQSSLPTAYESPVQRYDEAIAEKLSEKQLQVERIEDKLEMLLDRQTALIQATRARQPGRLSFPSSRARWLSQCQQQEATLQRIQSRLELVREVRDGISIYGGSRMGDLARDRLVHEQPELVAERDAAVRAERRSEQERRLSPEAAHLALGDSEKKSPTLSLRHHVGR